MQKIRSLADMVQVADTIEDQMPKEWFIVFHVNSRRRWLRWLPIGRFKHVSCFGWVESAQRWVFFDPALERNWLRIIPDEVAGVEPLHIFDIKAGYYGGDIGHYSSIGVVVHLKTHIENAGRPNVSFGIGCVRAVARTVGIRTNALLPDQFFQRCIRLGGQIMNSERMPR